MADENLFNFEGPDATGPRDNGTTVVLGDDDASVPTPTGGRYSSGLKFSTAVQDVTVTVIGTATGGRDAVVDANNSPKRLTILIAIAKATGQFIATIKGGAQDIALTIVKIIARGTVCEVILGDWSDQNHEWCKRISLSLKMADGSAVRLIVLASEWPTEVPESGPYRYLYVKPWFPDWLHHLIVFVFQTLRRWGLFRAQAN